MCTRSAIRTLLIGMIVTGLSGCSKPVAQKPSPLLLRTKSQLKVVDSIKPNAKQPKQGPGNWPGNTPIPGFKFQITLPTVPVDCSEMGLNYRGFQLAQRCTVVI